MHSGAQDWMPLANARPTSVNEPAAGFAKAPARRWSTRRRALVWGTTAGCVVALILVLPPLFAGWAPVLHRTCKTGTIAADEPFWIPAILVNAPYEGNVSGNASIPPGFIVDGQGFGSTDGMPASNGSVGGVFFHVWLALFSLVNTTVWGPGSNVACSHPFSMTATTDFNGSQVYSGILGNQGNLSDSAEPHSYNLTAPPGGSTVYFDNGFVSANTQDISTCGGPAKSVPVNSPEFTVWVPFAIGNRTAIVPYEIPFDQMFHYRFPSNGTWAIDNLSAPGGPGGGWAFSYSTCPP